MYTKKGLYSRTLFSCCLEWLALGCVDCVIAWAMENLTVSILLPLWGSIKWGWEFGMNSEKKGGVQNVFWELYHCEYPALVFPLKRVLWTGWASMNVSGKNTFEEVMRSPTLVYTLAWGPKRWLAGASVIAPHPPWGAVNIYATAGE